MYGYMNVPSPAPLVAIPIATPLQRSKWSAATVTHARKAKPKPKPGRTSEKGYSIEQFYVVFIHNFILKFRNSHEIPVYQFRNLNLKRDLRVHLLL